MKHLPLIVIVLLSITIGIWFGIQGIEQPAQPGLDHLGGDFTLQSDQGPVSLHDLEGKVVPIYFGYTHCPDVCITSLSKVGTALRQLSEEQRSQVQPIFISVDPERDTPQKTGEYARYFHPSILGLTDTPEVIAEVAKRYLVIYEKVEMEDSAMGYAVDHSSIVYVVGRNGKLAALSHHADTADELAAHLKAALDG